MSKVVTRGERAKAQGKVTFSRNCDELVGESRSLPTVVLEYSLSTCWLYKE